MLMKKVSGEIDRKTGGGKNGWRKNVFMAEAFFSGFCFC
jgi:hypothetical protein